MKQMMERQKWNRKARIIVIREKLFNDLTKEKRCIFIGTESFILSRNPASGGTVG